MTNGNDLLNGLGRPLGRAPLSPAMVGSPMGKRAWARWWLIGLAAAASVVGADDLRADPPTKTAVAECFQRGYQPPPCTSTSSTAPAVPDSGVNACQNQSAMATAIGLLPAVCPATTHN